jgi:CysZ protein
MIIEAAIKALKRLPTPEFRSVLWKTLGLTLLLLVGLWVGIRQLFFTLAWPWMAQLLPGMPEWAGWLGIAAAIVAGLGLALVLALMIAPVTALVAGIFLDDVADVVEREDYPGEPAGTPLPLGRSVVVSLKFLGGRSRQYRSTFSALRTRHQSDRLFCDQRLFAGAGIL